MAKEDYKEKNRSFGRRLTKIRCQENVRAKDLAEKLGKDPSYISQYEIGYKHPKESTIAEIAEILDYPVCAFDDGFLDTETAMHRLFRVYEVFDGQVKSGTEIKNEITSGEFDEHQMYISVHQLDDMILAWWAQTKLYENGDITKEELSKWMDKFQLRADCMDIDTKRIREIRKKQNKSTDK